MGTKKLFLIDVSRRATAYQFPAPPAQKQGIVDDWLRHFRRPTHVTENTAVSKFIKEQHIQRISGVKARCLLTTTKKLVAIGGWFYYVIALAKENLWPILAKNRRRWKGKFSI